MISFKNSDASTRYGMLREQYYDQIIFLRKADTSVQYLRARLDDARKEEFETIMKRRSYTARLEEEVLEYEQRIGIKQEIDQEELPIKAGFGLLERITELLERRDSAFEKHIAKRLNAPLADMCVSYIEQSADTIPELYHVAAICYTPFTRISQDDMIVLLYRGLMRHPKDPVIMQDLGFELVGRVYEELKKENWDLAAFWADKAEHLIRKAVQKTDYRGDQSLFSLLRINKSRELARFRQQVRVARP